ncbi:hypothetical protein DV738_g3725, partial [Chaetothyriales sp. CBS 135597]
MIEDDAYRRSTQYRLWSFTTSQLSEQRRKTNHLAAEKVRAQFRREIEQAILTPEDEVRLVDWGVRKVQDIAEIIGQARDREGRVGRYRIRSNVVAEHFYLPVPVITSSLRAELDPSITDESIKAPEFLILQALRFTLDVPRVSEVAGRVKQLLAKDVQGTDAYFLYTPSQICLAVWKIADAELLDAYLHAKLAELSTTSTSTTGSGSGSLPEGFAEQLRSTVDDCARLITTTYHDPDDKASRKVLNRISKKLMVCADPDKIDIVA